MSESAFRPGTVPVTFWSEFVATMSRDSAYKVWVAILLIVGTVSSPRITVVLVALSSLYVFGGSTWRNMRGHTGPSERARFAAEFVYIILPLMLGALGGMAVG